MVGERFLPLRQIARLCMNCVLGGDGRSCWALSTLLFSAHRASQRVAEQVLTFREDLQWATWAACQTLRLQLLLGGRFYAPHIRDEQGESQSRSVSFPDLLTLLRG